MDTITIYGRPGCGYCQAAKNYLEQRGHVVNYVDIAETENNRKIMFSLVTEALGHPPKTVPQIFSEQHGYIGGYAELISSYNYLYGEIHG